MRSLFVIFFSVPRYYASRHLRQAASACACFTRGYVKTSKKTVCQRQTAQKITISLPTKIYVVLTNVLSTDAAVLYSAHNLSALVTPAALSAPFLACACVPPPSKPHPYHKSVGTAALRPVSGHMPETARHPAPHTAAPRHPAAAVSPPRHKQAQPARLL